MRALPQRTPPAPASVEDVEDDDWDPRFYLPALLVVLTANACALWWLAAHAR